MILGDTVLNVSGSWWKRMNWHSPSRQLCGLGSWWGGHEINASGTPALGAWYMPQKVGSKWIMEGRASLNHNQCKVRRGDRGSRSVSLFILFPRFLFVGSGGEVAMVWTHPPGLLSWKSSGRRQIIRKPENSTEVKVSLFYTLLISLANLYLISSMIVLIAYAFARLCQLQLKFSVLFHGASLVLWTAAAKSCEFTIRLKKAYRK